MNYETFVEFEERNERRLHSCNWNALDDWTGRGIPLECDTYSNDFSLRIHSQFAPLLSRYVGSVLQSHRNAGPTPKKGFQDGKIQRRAHVELVCTTPICHSNQSEHFPRRFPDFWESSEHINISVDWLVKRYAFIQTAHIYLYSKAAF